MSWLSTSDAAHLLGVTPKTVRRWLDAGTLQKQGAVAVRVGALGQWRITAASVRSMVAAEEDACAKKYARPDVDLGLHR